MKEYMHKNFLFLLNIFFLVFSNTSAMEITEIQKLPTEIIKVMITSAVLQELTNNPEKPDVSLVATVAQLNKYWAESMVVLYKQLIDQGSQLLKCSYFLYIEENLKTPIARAISEFNDKNVDMRLDNPTIIAAMNHSYFMVNYTQGSYSHLRNACLYTNPVIVATLLKMGAIITQEDFAQTVRCNQSDQEYGITCAQLLLQQNPALINAPADDSDTALDWSVTKGNHRIMQFLIDHKADVNIGNSYGFTPLHKAIHNVFSNKKNTTLKSVQILIAAGANPLNKINSGFFKNYTAFDLVKKLHTQDNVLTLFGQQLWYELRKFKDVERSHGTAVYMGRVSTVEKNS